MNKGVALFGCGAVGSLLAMNLSTPDWQLYCIDDDRVDENNIGTSAFYQHHIGAFKATVLAEMLYRKAGMICTVSASTYEGELWFEPELVLDCFDNADSRRLLCGLGIPTLHVGVSRERTGAIVWDEDYTLPDGAPRGEDQFCTHQAGRAILRATAAVAARIVENFLETGVKRSLLLTEDFNVYE